MTTLRVLPSKWGPIALVCKKCGKKVGGGFGRKNKHDLVDVLRDHLKETDRRRAVRVVETGCLGICPKGTVAVALSDRVLSVPPGTAPEAVVALIAPRIVPPATDEAADGPVSAGLLEAAGPG